MFFRFACSVTKLLTHSSMFKKLSQAREKVANFSFFLKRLRHL
jgi:hypothetical protein